MPLAIGLPKLYEITVDQEHQFLEAHQRRVHFYTALISAALALTVAGAMEADRWIDYAVLLVGPLVIAGLAYVARGGTMRFYQRFLGAVVLRAKLEQALGFANPALVSTPEYWSDDSLLSERVLADRKKHKNSDAYFSDLRRRKTGYQSATLWIMNLFMVTAGALAVVLIVAAFVDASKVIRL